MPNRLKQAALEPTLNKVRVWDLPTRVFHWSLVLCFTGLVVTGELAGDAMVWHFRLGYCALTLLLFRLAWGFVGGHWSRFATFVASPSTILRYLRGNTNSGHTVGHNPLGSLSVLALLFCTLLQVSTGLFSDDEIATAGPLAKMAATHWVSSATFYHTQVGKVIVIFLVLLHIAAVLFYRLKKGSNLIPAMVHGDKIRLAQFESSRDDVVTRVLAAVIFGVCASAVAYVLRWAGSN